MATTPTNLPVPSESQRDLKFNAGKIDEFVTSLVNTYVDRLGNEHYTIEGLRWLAQQAIAQYGWIPVGTFQDGATLTSPNQILKDTTDSEYYRWDGSFLPSGKVVPNGSTPGTTGGVGVGAWLSVGDSTLRQFVDSTYRTTGYSKVQNATFQSGATLTTNNQVLWDNVSGLYWMWAGSTPKTVNANDNPSMDAGYYAVGLLNGKDISDLSGWCDTVSNVDVTYEMQQYFRTLGYLGLKAFGAGAVTVSSRITIPNVEFDFSNLTITIDPNSDSSVSGSSGKLLYLIDPETVELTGQSFTTSNIGQLATIQLSGSAYRNRTVGIEGEGDSNRAYLRGTFGTYTQAADLYVVDDSGSGYHGDTPALFKYNGTAKHVIRPLRPEMVVRGPTFVLPSPLSGSRSLRCCIQIERNSVTLIGGTINSQSSGLLVESYVSLRNVTDCSVIDVNMLNNNTQASYVVLAYCTNRLLVQRCRSLSGWALVDGNFMRNTVVTDSYGATIGCHAMAWNFTVERCTLGATLVNGIYQGGVSLTGGGDLNVKRCQYWYRGGDRYLDHPVSTRGDYGQAWEGNINIEDMDIYMYEQPPAGQGLACLYLNGADFGSTDLTRDCYLGKKISIKRVRLKVMSAAWAADRIVFNPAWFQTTYTQNVRYPSEYLVEDLSLETSGPGWTMDPRWPSVISNPMAVIGTTKSTLRRCQLNQGNTSNMVFISAAAATTYRVTAELLVEDCYGTLYAGISLPAGNTLTIRRTNIGGLPIGNANSAGTIKIERCTINGTVCGGSTGADIIYFYENHITTTNPVTVGTLAKYCHGNTVPAGGGISGRSVDEWYSYRDSSIFRTT
ncbi:TPA: hypothetical protein ACOEGS_000789 [Enterobacter hormaechei subsp. xiangfangensis]|uniref:tail fiber/spike domain-containing protein n=1 Tax=Enterobacter hormaechei TaxID=158836 RepID=UPI000792DDD5|nr:hypothetical protein [Enterobacter hormaechei]MDS0936724.1 hypothetical protein [Enterobacter hormaechei]MDU5330208.1 hypothetical protein [Enterobacter hormaechei]SAG11817.1 T7 tail fiber protein [Enterobacter hormaechei]SAG37828.1 T7 tail fiber protein [Enterobacter hormaechei]HBL5474305.1 hypothetical protein [Enterobacter hormaechei]